MSKFSFFTTTFVVLLADDQVGHLRDFTLMSQLACCTNLAAMGYSVANNVSLSKSMFYTLNFDTFVTLLAFAHCGGGDLLNSTPLGVWNTVQLVGLRQEAAEFQSKRIFLDGAVAIKVRQNNSIGIGTAAVEFQLFVAATVCGLKCQQYRRLCVRALHIQ